MQTRTYTRPYDTHPPTVTTGVAPTARPCSTAHCFFSAGESSWRLAASGFRPTRPLPGCRRSPLVVRARLLELRCRARPCLPSTLPAQHQSSHLVGCRLVRRHPHNPRRQRLEPLVVPPLRLGHLAALVQPQHFEGTCRGLCPALRAHRIACPELASTAPRLAYAKGSSGLRAMASRLVPQTFSYQLRIRVARLRGVPGRLLCGVASPLLHRPTILYPLPLLPHLLVKRPVQLPSARVRRAVDAARVRRRQLLIAALIADG
eukprot:scaffold75500_cov36-Phaeocystis_antarctica.AAC.3